MHYFLVQLSLKSYDIDFIEHIIYYGRLTYVCVCKCDIYCKCDLYATRIRVWEARHVFV